MSTLQVASRVKGRIAMWQIDTADLTTDDPIAEARAVVAEAIEQETKQAPGVILVGIQGNKQ